MPAETNIKSIPRKILLYKLIIDSLRPKILFYDVTDDYDSTENQYLKNIFHQIHMKRVS